MRKQLICDKQLVSRYIKGDESALVELIELHKRKIYEYIFSFVKDRDKAEDLFQETFYKVITNMKKGSYNECGKFLPWVLSISRNLIMDSYRNEKKLVTLSTIKDKDGKAVELLEVLDVPDEDPKIDLISLESRKKIRPLIRCLDRDQQEIIILRHYFGMSFREIAERNEMSINTALGRMHYALNNLNKIIKEQGIEIWSATN